MTKKEELDRSAAYDRGKLIGECEFEPSADKWVLTHTGVREAYEGKEEFQDLLQ